MHVRYAMSYPPVSVPPTASLEETAQYMAEARVGALPVVTGDEVIGVVTDRDLVLRAMAQGLSLENRVETVMTGEPMTVDADTALTVALQTMRSVQTRHLPVMADGQLVGMLSFDDVLWYLAQQFGDLAAVVQAARQIGPGATAP